MPRTAIVVGAGLGGLATAIALRRSGWTVTVLEAASQVGEVGAGIQIPPNSSRFLLRWGLGPAMEAVVCRPQLARSYRYANMDPLQVTPFATEERYTYPYWHAHRADFHKVLLDEAVRPTLSAPATNPGPPVKLVTNSSVVDVDCEKATVKTQDGRSFSADLLVGADGVRSVVKRFVTGEPDNGLPSGDQAYRFVIPVEKIAPHPELAFALEHQVNNWWCPNRHVVHYPIRSYKLCNVVAVCPDDATSEESWTAGGNLEELLETFKDCDPRLLKLFSLADSFNRWQLLKRAPLKTWTRGRTALLGDACHAMVPYLAQGAAMAVEDAAALAAALDSNVSIEQAIKSYEKVRLPRTTMISSGADNNRNVFHMVDGPGQKARDEMVKKAQGQVSNVFDAAWRYDAVEEMKKEMAKM